MTRKERATLNLLRNSLECMAGNYTKAARDHLDITAMAAQQVLDNEARLARKFGPLEEDEEYWLHLSRLEARAQRLAARVDRATR